MLNQENVRRFLKWKVILPTRDKASQRDGPGGPERTGGRDGGARVSRPEPRRQRMTHGRSVTQRLWHCVHKISNEQRTLRVPPSGRRVSQICAKWKSKRPVCAKIKAQVCVGKLRNTVDRSMQQELGSGRHLEKLNTPLTWIPFNVFELHLQYLYLSRRSSKNLCTFYPLESWSGLKEKRHVKRNNTPLQHSVCIQAVCWGVLAGERPPQKSPPWRTSVPRFITLTSQSGSPCKHTGQMKSSAWRMRMHLFLSPPPRPCDGDYSAEVGLVGSGTWRRRRMMGELWEMKRWNVTLAERRSCSHTGQRD